MDKWLVILYINHNSTKFLGEFTHPLCILWYLFSYADAYQPICTPTKHCDDFHGDDRLTLANTLRQLETLDLLIPNQKHTISRGDPKGVKPIIGRLLTIIGRLFWMAMYI